MFSFLSKNNKYGLYNPMGVMIGVCHAASTEKAWHRFASVKKQRKYANVKTKEGKIALLQSEGYYIRRIIES